MYHDGGAQNNSNFHNCMLERSQREAVEESACSHVFVQAPPGSGKTTVLAARVSHLIDNCGVPPSRILAVTYTRKGAIEMVSRCPRGPMIRTMHSLSLALLSVMSEYRYLATGLSTRPSIPSRSDIRGIFNDIASAAPFSVSHPAIPHLFKLAFPSNVARSKALLRGPPARLAYMFSVSDPAPPQPQPSSSSSSIQPSQTRHNVSQIPPSSTQPASQPNNPHAPVLRRSSGRHDDPATVAAIAAAVDSRLAALGMIRMEKLVDAAAAVICLVRDACVVATAPTAPAPQADASSPAARQSIGAAHNAIGSTDVHAPAPSVAPSPPKIASLPLSQSFSCLHSRTAHRAGYGSPSQPAPDFCAPTTALDQSRPVRHGDMRVQSTQIYPTPTQLAVPQQCAAGGVPIPPTAPCCDPATVRRYWHTVGRGRGMTPRDVDDVLQSAAAWRFPWMHIIVDEAQDLLPPQTAVICALASMISSPYSAPSPSHSGTDYGPSGGPTSHSPHRSEGAPCDPLKSGSNGPPTAPWPCLFVVGDVCQAIYAYAGAGARNMAALISVAHSTPNRVVRRSLVTNFRSSPALIESFNALTKAAFKHMTIVPQVPAHPLQRTAKTAADSAAAVAAGDDSVPIRTATDTSAAWAAAVASWAARRAGRVPRKDEFPLVAIRGAHDDVVVGQAVAMAVAAARGGRTVAILTRHNTTASLVRAAVRCTGIGAVGVSVPAKIDVAADSAGAHLADAAVLAGIATGRDCDDADADLAWDAAADEPAARHEMGGAKCEPSTPSRGDGSTWDGAGPKSSPSPAGPLGAAHALPLRPSPQFRRGGAASRSLVDSVVAAVSNALRGPVLFALAVRDAAPQRRNGDWVSALDAAQTAGGRPAGRWGAQATYGRSAAAPGGDTAPLNLLMESYGEGAYDELLQRTAMAVTAGVLRAVGGLTSRLLRFTAATARLVAYEAEYASRRSTSFPSTSPTPTRAVNASGAYDTCPSCGGYDVDVVVLTVSLLRQCKDGAKVRLGGWGERSIGALLGPAHSAVEDQCAVLPRLCVCNTARGGAPCGSQQRGIPAKRARAPPASREDDEADWLFGGASEPDLAPTVGPMSNAPAPGVRMGDRAAAASATERPSMAESAARLRNKLTTRLVADSRRIVGDCDDDDTIAVITAWPGCGPAAVAYLTAWQRAVSTVVVELYLQAAPTDPHGSGGTFQPHTQPQAQPRAPSWTPSLLQVAVALYRCGVEAADPFGSDTAPGGVGGAAHAPPGGRGRGVGQSSRRSAAAARAPAAAPFPPAPILRVAAGALPVPSRGAGGVVVIVGGADRVLRRPSGAVLGALLETSAVAALAAARLVDRSVPPASLRAAAAAAGGAAAAADATAAGSAGAMRQTRDSTRTPQEDLRRFVEALGGPPPGSDGAVTAAAVRGVFETFTDTLSDAAAAAAVAAVRASGVPVDKPLSGTDQDSDGDADTHQMAACVWRFVSAVATAGPGAPRGALLSRRAAGHLAAWASEANGVGKMVTSAVDVAADVARRLLLRCSLACLSSVGAETAAATEADVWGALVGDVAPTPHARHGPAGHATAPMRAAGAGVDFHAASWRWDLWEHVVAGWRSDRRVDPFPPISTSRVALTPPPHMPDSHSYVPAPPAASNRAAVTTPTPPVVPTAPLGALSPAAAARARAALGFSMGIGPSTAPIALGAVPPTASLGLGTMAPPIRDARAHAPAREDATWERHGGGGLGLGRVAPAGGQALRGPVAPTPDLPPLLLGALSYCQAPFAYECHQQSRTRDAPAGTVGQDPVIAHVPTTLGAMARAPFTCMADWRRREAVAALRAAASRWCLNAADITTVMADAAAAGGREGDGDADVAAADEATVALWMAATAGLCSWGWEELEAAIAWGSPAWGRAAQGTAGALRQPSSGGWDAEGGAVCDDEVPVVAISRGIPAGAAHESYTPAVKDLHSHSDVGFNIPPAMSVIGANALGGRATPRGSRFHLPSTDEATTFASGSAMRAGASCVGGAPLSHVPRSGMPASAAVHGAAAAAAFGSTRGAAFSNASAPRSIVAPTVVRSAAVAVETIAVGTIHAAKGGEWDVVIVLYTSDPIITANDPEVFYVACTRARMRLVVGYLEGPIAGAARLCRIDINTDDRGRRTKETVRDEAVTRAGGGNSEAFVPTPLLWCMQSSSVVVDTTMLSGEHEQRKPHEQMQHVMVGDAVASGMATCSVPWM